MANVTEASTFEENVYELAVNDPVEGGSDGVDNLPHRQLANRTRWLYDTRMDGTAWWIPESGVVAYVNATQFTVAGDKTEIYIEGRAVCLVQDVVVFGHVYTAAYSAGSGLTTVTVNKPIVDGTLAGVKYGQEVYNSPTGEIPVGSEMFWPLETPPDDHWMFEAGYSLACASYPELYAKIGWNFGKPDNDHFNLPDERGRVLRVWANGSLNDPDRNSRTAPPAAGAILPAGDHVGTHQGYQTKAHDHGAAGAHTHNVTLLIAPTDVSGATYIDGTSYGDYGAKTYTTTSSGSHTHSSVGGNETRMINTSRMLIMKVY